MAGTLNKTWALMRRELWESPVAFKWTPIMIAGFLVFTTVLLMILGMRYDQQMAFTLDGIRMIAEQPEEYRRLVISGGLFAISAVFSMVLVFVVVFYLAGSLFEDRKDRSILYWKSLPVSDTVTVASKVLTACLLVPGLFLVGIVLTQLLMLGMATFYASMAGVSAWEVFWKPANLPKIWLILASGYLVQALWLFPIYGWLMFCSSWAPRLPFLIAAAVPLVVSMVQHFWSLFTDFRLPDFNIALIILMRLFQGVVPVGVNAEWGQLDGGHQGVVPSDDMLISFGSVFSHLVKPELWGGVVIGLVLMAAAVYFRRKATDN